MFYKKSLQNALRRDPTAKGLHEISIAFVDIK